MKKFFFLHALLFIATGQIHAQCKEGNCYNGYGTYYYSNGPRYEGNWREGQRHGKGTLYFNDGAEHSGEWENDELVKCRCTNSDGSRYEGEIRDQNYEGEGTYYFTDGGRYVGEWKDGERNGQGTLYDGKKVRYSGMWRDGELYGQGTYYYSNGGRYEGAMVRGMKDGIGTLYYGDGTKYSGRWVNDMKNGKGMITYSNGSQYTGEWKDDQKSGRGTYNYSEGDKYVGEWKDNMKHGEGIYYYKGGHSYSGEWKNDKKNGYGVYTFEAGIQYQGQWRDNDRHGAGKMIDDGVVITEGFWVNDEFRGNDYEESYFNTDESVDDVEATSYNDDEDGDTDSQNSYDDQDAGDSKVYAVIVGVANYSHNPPLKYSDNDAFYIYSHLKSPEGGALPQKQVEVLIDEDAGRDNIIETMERLFSRADNNDLIMFYFSGHGSSGAFAAYDGDGPSESALYHSDVMGIMKSSKAKHRIIIADACHAGSLKSVTKSTPSSDVIAGYYEALDESEGGSGTAILVSCKAEEKSLESQGIRQGIFSYYLKNGLLGEADTDEDMVVSLDELYRFVRINTMKYTNNFQTPTLNGSGYDPDMPLSVVRGN